MPIPSHLGKTAFWSHSVFSLQSFGFVSPLINASNDAAAASIRRLTCFVVFDVVVVIVVVGDVFVVFVVKPSKKTKVRC